MNHHNQTSTTWSCHHTSDVSAILPYDVKNLAEANLLYNLSADTTAFCRVQGLPVAVASISITSPRFLLCIT